MLCFVMVFTSFTLGLPTTKLGTYLENRVNSFLKKKDSGAGEVTLRVLSCTDKDVEVKSGMKAR
jgi:E1A/CREB-binding protein